MSKSYIKYPNSNLIPPVIQSDYGHLAAEPQPQEMDHPEVITTVRESPGQWFAQTTSIHFVSISHKTYHQTIGSSGSGLSGPFFTAIRKGARQAAGLHVCRLLRTDTFDNDARQSTGVSALIEQGVQALIINPVKTETISAGLEWAHQQGMPVITLEHKATGGQTICHIAADNFEGGV